jgi:hypothetical protein
MGSPDGCDAEYPAWRKIKVGAVATSKVKDPALAIRLRWQASFHKKLRQLIGKYVTKRRPEAGAFCISPIGRVRGKF